MGFQGCAYVTAFVLACFSIWLVFTGALIGCFLWNEHAYARALLLTLAVEVGLAVLLVILWWFVGGMDYLYMEALYR
jgi:magnesium-transporting ATPase (P-type)